MTYESSGSSSSEHEEPLSATAMFLRSLEEPSAAPSAIPGAPAPAAPAPKAEAGWPAPAAAPASEPAQVGPGEFTRMFQAAPRQEFTGPSAAPQASPFANAGPVPSSSAVASAAAPSTVGPNSSGASAGPGANAAPGEFTRIFSAGMVSQEAKTVVEPPPFAPPAVPAASASSRKGFSAIGVSDSASGEGSVTQIFKPMAQAAPQTAPAAPVVPDPPYTPAAEPSWKPEPAFAAQSTPASGPSITSMISTLAAQGNSSPGRKAEPVPYTPAAVPSYTPDPAYSPAAPPQQASTPEAGSVTRLIQRLAQAPPEPPPAPPTVFGTPAASPASGPGEFTRMISAAAFAPAAGALPAGAAPTSAGPAAAAPGFPAAPAFPPAPQFAMPHAQPAAPPLHLPQTQMPKPPAMPAPPAIAAPKGKLEGMVPILLIVNTFLLVLILVVVLFAMKGH